jgi:hypothetical protein
MSLAVVTLHATLRSIKLFTISKKKRKNYEEHVNVRRSSLLTRGKDVSR